MDPTAPVLRLVMNEVPAPRKFELACVALLVTELPVNAVVRIGSWIWPVRPQSAKLFAVCWPDAIPAAACSDLQAAELAWQIAILASAFLNSWRKPFANPFASFSFRD